MTPPLDVETPVLERTPDRPRANAKHRVTSSSPKLETVNLLGVRVHAVSSAEALDRIDRWIAGSDRSRLVMTPDTTALMQAQSTRQLRDAYRQADLVTADGAGLVWASRQLRHPLPERVTGIDLLSELCHRAARRRHRVYLLGAQHGVAQDAGTILSRRHPGLTIAGTHHGYFDDSHSDHVIQEINASAPDVLFVGMGVPRQEIWMSAHAHELDVPVVMGVGGSFDVLAGHMRRAPQSWQTLGLEWLWRAMWEPRRLWRARLIPRFMLQILSERSRYVSP